MAGRRFAVYFAWSRPREFATPRGVEQSTPLAVLEDRYPTLFEFRRAVWPAFEHLKDPKQFNQSIAGFFDHVVLPDFDLFGRVVKEATGNEVAVIQRETDAPPPRQLDDQFFQGLDTLILVSLDHNRTEQAASPGEVEAIRAFLGREGRCLVVCPHHDIGSGETLESQRLEHDHHGDVTIPARQRLGGFARSVLVGLGVPVRNQFGLNPARLADSTPAPLVVARDLPDVDAVLKGVITFNLHPHLPHLTVDPEYRDRVDILARQPINPTAPRHPFTDAGNRHFDALLRVRVPDRPGLVLVADATLWSSAFGGLASLQAFWRNLALLPV
jgi:hypothetical protein